MRFLLEKWEENISGVKTDLKSITDSLELFNKLEWIDRGDYIQLYLWDDNIWEINDDELYSIEEYKTFDEYHDNISAAINIYPEEGKIKVMEPGNGRFTQSFEDKEEMIEEVGDLIKQFDNQILKKERYIIGIIGEYR